MADTSRTVEYVIKVTDQATAQLARIEHQLVAFGQSVQRTQAAAVATMGPGMRQAPGASPGLRPGGGGAGVAQAAQQAAQSQAQAARQAAQEQAQAARQAAQVQAQAARQAAQEQLQAARLAAQGQMQQARLAAQGQAQEARLAAQEQLQAARLAAQGQMQQARQAAQAQAQQDASAQGLQSRLQSLRGLYVALSTYVGGQFVRSMVQTAGQMQSLRLSFDALSGSVQTGGQHFEFIRRTAATFGFDLATVGQSYRQFIASTQTANLGLETQQRLFTSMTAAARLAGASQEQLSRGFIGLSQALDRGVLQAEEFNQIQEAIPGVMSRVAQALGRTVNELRTGGVSAREFARGLEQALAGDIPRAAQIGATSIESMVARMTNSWKEFLGALGQSSEVIGIVKSLGSAIQDVHDLLANLGVMAARALTPLQKIDEEMARLRDTRGQTLLQGGLFDEALQKRLADLAEQRLKIIRDTNQATAAGAPAARQKEEAQALEASLLQWDRQNQAMVKTGEVLRTVGASALKQWNAELDMNRKRQEELLEQLTKQQDLAPKVRTALVLETKDLMARQQQLEKMLDTASKAAAAEEERVRTLAAAAKDLAEAASREETQRYDAELRRREGYEAERLALTQGADAAEDFRATREAMSEAQRRAANETLQTSEALRADTRVLAQWTEQMQRAIETTRSASLADVGGPTPFRPETPKSAEDFARSPAFERLTEELRDLERIRQRLLLNPIDFALWALNADQAARGVQQLTAAQNAQLRVQMEALALLARQQQMQREWEQTVVDSVTTMGDAIVSNVWTAIEGIALEGKKAGDVMVEIGRSILATFGQTMINVAFKPVQMFLEQWAEQLAKSKLIQGLIGTVVGALGGAAGGALGAGPGGIGTLPFGAHGGIFGAPQATQFGALFAAPAVRLLAEATPEAVVPLTEAGIARFTRGLARGAGGEGTGPGQAAAQQERRWHDTIDQLAKRPIEVQVVIAAPVDMSAMRTTPEEIVRVVGENVQQDGTLRRIIQRHGQR